MLKNTAILNIWLKVMNICRSFWNLAEVPFKIKKIDTQNLECAVKTAYGSQDYCFYQNAELIDVKDRFRIFNFKGCNYLSKKMPLKKAALEISNSQKAAQILSGKIINGKNINIIIPEQVILNASSDECFLVSEYLGHTLHESTYSGIYPSFTLADCFAFLKEFLKNGIVYRGFLQRNIIVKDNNVFLFDWEDSVFKDKISQDEFNNLWRTNFILNWSYIFNYDEVSQGVVPFTEKHTLSTEPPLVKYENVFKNLVNINVSDFALRNIIEKIVFTAELPVSLESKYFYIRPHDTGHLIADTFPNEIDVLYDILACSIRKKNEAAFLRLLQLITKFYALFYKNRVSATSKLSLPLQYYILIPFMIGLDNISCIPTFEKIMAADTMNEAIEIIQKEYKPDVFVNLYLRRQLKGNLENIIRQIIISVCPEARSDNIKNIENISQYILKISDTIAEQDAA